MPVRAGGLYPGASCAKCAVSAANVRPGTHALASAAPVPTAIPFRKSLRVMARFMPSSRSRARLASSLVMKVLCLGSSSLLARYNLRHRTMALINSNVGVGVAIGVGIGNVDPPEWLSPNYARALGSGPVKRFKQRVVLVGISMRPAVHGDGLNVASGIEASSGENPAKLIANIALEDPELRAEQFVAARSILIFAGKARFA